MYKHLFVPIDGSELSHRAVDGSIGLAKQLGARITGFIVEPEMPLTIISGDATASIARMKGHTKKNEAHAAALLGQFEERCNAEGVPFTGHSATAYRVEHSIAEEAEKAGCDMIVMATHGRGKLGELVYGSHSKKVMGLTKLPILILQ